MRDEKLEKSESKSRKISDDSFAGNFENSENSDSPISSDIDDFVDVERDSATSGFSSGTDGKVHDHSAKFGIKNQTKIENKKGMIIICKG